MTVRIVEEGTPFEVAPADRAHLARLLRVTLQWREDGMVVWSVVGHVGLPSGTTLVIRSKKAPAACILAWAAYVDPTLADLNNIRQLDGIADEGDIVQALACLLVRELLSVTGNNGLRRRYRRVATRSATLRGSVDFAALSRAGGDLSRIPCTVWERLPKTPLNQLFSYALQTIRRDPVMRPAVGGLANELEAIFVDVAPALDPDLLGGRRPLDRDELPYAAACALARLLLRDLGLATGNQRQGLGFIVRLDSLFERAVVRALENAGLPVKPKHPAVYFRLNGSSMTREHLELDCFLPIVGGGGLVIDAKYKSAVSPSNIAQMVAYCHLTGVDRAILVFPKGTLATLHPYRLPSPAGRDVHVELVELDTSARTVGRWRDNARSFSDRIERLSEIPFV